MKKILITSTDMMMMQFLLPHVYFLREQGYDVEVACSNVGGRIHEVINAVGKEKVHNVELYRNPIKIGNLKGLKQLKKIVNSGNYDLVWTNEPVMGVMTRIAAKKARKKGTKVVYMTHGYHFFKGGQKKYKIFYPIEKWASKYCDAIITINWEDYYLTKEKFHAQIVEHIDGIGLDTEKFSHKIDIEAKKKELGLTNEFVVLSVGELKPHKNHITVIRAMAKLKDENIIYLICGKGELFATLQKEIKELGIENKVKFLGYRKDINEIMQCADVFAFPSKREGLGLAALEAMAAGLPIIGARTRGVVDYVIDGETGYLCEVENYHAYADQIKHLYNDKNDLEEISKKSSEMIYKYDIKNIQEQVLKIVVDQIGKRELNGTKN